MDLGVSWWDIAMKHVTKVTQPKVVSALVDQGPFLDFLEKQLRNLMAGLGDKKAQND